MTGELLAFPPAWRDALDGAGRAALNRAATHVAASENSGTTVYPPPELRYRALQAVSPASLRVLILGQDPYHGPQEAMGLAFSVREGVRIPPSLRNIMIELHRDLGVRPATGDLSAWADQGVLLLNSVLTVEAGAPRSHAAIGWELVTDQVIAHAARAAPRPVVFMFWGKMAQKKMPLVTQSRHLILCAAHPSPFGAYRGFFGCSHFLSANRFLSAAGRGPILWGERLPREQGGSRGPQ